MMPAGSAERPLHELRTRRRIEFADTDMGGIVHFSRFFVFMETAEHQFLEALGAQVYFRDGEREIGWPRIAASCDYESPARLGELLDVHLRVERKGRTSMTYAVTFRSGGRLVARGRVASVCCVMNDPDGLRAVPIPQALAGRIAEAPPI